MKTAYELIAAETAEKIGQHVEQFRDSTIVDMAAIEAHILEALRNVADLAVRNSVCQNCHN